MYKWGLGRRITSRFGFDLSTGKIIVFLAVIYFAFLFPSPEYPFYNAHDGSYFVTLGINLAEGGRYTTDTFIADGYGKHGTWPFIFPLFIAGIVSVVGVSWIAIKIALVVIGLANLYLLSRLLEDSTEKRAVVLLVGLSPIYFLFSHHAMTEIPYMFLITSALISIKKTDTVAGAVVAGLIGVLAFFTRGYAVTLIFAGLVFFLAKREWALSKRLVISSLFVAPLIIAVVAWASYTNSVLEGGNLDHVTARYGNGTGLIESAQRPITDYIQKLYWHDLRYPLYLMVPVLSLDVVLRSDIAFAISLVILGLSVYGWAWSLRSRLSIEGLWMFFAVGLLIIQAGSSVRYWLPVLPFLFYFFLVGIENLRTRFLGERRIEIMVLSGLVVTAIIGLAVHLWEPDRLRFRSAEWREFRDVAAWAQNNLADEAVIVSHAPNNFFVVSGRQTFPIREISPEAWPPDSLKSRAAIYVLCSYPIQTSAGASGWGALCGALASRDSLELIYHKSSVGLFRFRHRQ